MNMKKMMLSLFSLSIMATGTAMTASNVLAVELSTERFSSSRYDSIEKFFVANAIVFNCLNRSGINVQDLLTEEEYQIALRRYEDGIVVTKYIENGNFYFNVIPNNHVMMKIWDYVSKDSRMILKILVQL